MPTLIAAPSRVVAHGNKPKLIDEFVGRVNNDEARVSIAHMRSPPGWQEPGQRPEFDEYTVVLAGTLVLETEGPTLEVSAGQAVLVRAGEWVRYSTPGAAGAEYIAVCLPAFGPDIVHRDIVHRDIVHRDIVHRDIVHRDIVHRDIVHRDIVHRDIVHRDAVHPEDA